MRPSSRVNSVKAIRKLTVRTSLPERLAELETLATNLRWSWHQPTRQLFREISVEGWRATGHDPIQLLGWIGKERLEELAEDDDFVARVEEQVADLRHYLSQARWYQSVEDAPESIAYFSPEFGITSSLPQYSGGLGILAGDHLKTASDMGVPITGVGLFYQSGYFRQQITREGWQHEAYPVLDPDGLPLKILREPDGTAATISLALPGDKDLRARIWQAVVGRVTLLLLDTNVQENEPDIRSISDRLYGGGGEHRLRQELLLGIGGVRAIRKFSEITGIPVPTVFHSNEGHAGFLGIERMSRLVGEGLNFEEALAAVRAGTVFTVHTPVPAGIDRFEMQLVREHLTGDLVPGLDADAVLSLGAEDDPNVFNMAHLGFSLAQRANGVAKLHGKVARSMFSGLWPSFDTDEVPITSVTNGVHAPTWTAYPIKRLAYDILGTNESSKADWGSEALSDETLWAVRREMREHMVGEARKRTAARFERNEGAAPIWASRVLDPDVLTIGFARRGATYKRLTLMLNDPERLKALLTHPERPVQIVVAGKAHPADDAGKNLIQQLVNFAKDSDVRERIVFLENYDISMAKSLYPGCDVWLNNPLRPMEACGTSGMKAALNGSLNLSILDGWWDEYSDGVNGWDIPSAGGHMPEHERDAEEAAAFYDLVEHEIAPRFYDRDEHDVPRAWISQVRHTLTTLSPEVSAERMMTEYVERLYKPAHRAARESSADGYRQAREFAAWRERVRGAWEGVSIGRIVVRGVDRVPKVGDVIEARVLAELGELGVDDVLIEVIAGPVNADGDIKVTARFQLQYSDDADGKRVYRALIPLDHAGTFGYTVRALPKHSGIASDAELGLVTYANA